MSYPAKVMGQFNIRVVPPSIGKFNLKVTVVLSETITYLVFHPLINSWNHLDDDSNYKWSVYIEN
jgi:hypothetical protein